jgi:hypothetical protein
MKRIVLIAGFESFNADLYRKAAHLAQQRCPELDIRVFSDRSLPGSAANRASPQPSQGLGLRCGSLVQFVRLMLT